MKQFIDKIGAKQDLTFLESKEAFKKLMEGKAKLMIKRYLTF